ncbi:universal stress protein [Actinomadura gamaensis]|uniref:Universal stress protein n=1 Tax=Actinomadura gamaensis TaxID=1763541 RepID=A0ABV9TSJ6_9ACTN
MKAVVVGVDTSPGARRAASWAAAEAAAHGAPLLVVHTVPAWADDLLARPPGAGPDPWARAVGRRVLRDVVDELCERFPDMPVACELETGETVTRLLARARTARLLVVGARGAGGFRPPLVGPVGLKLAAHARCPVVVVRANALSYGRIVAGFDGSSTAQAALEFAFAEASAHGARLRVVHAWSAPLNAPTAPGLAEYRSPDARERRLRALREAVAPWRDKYPEVEVSEEAPHGHAVEILTALSAAADLLVVGSRGAGGFADLRSGAVSTGVLHHARCPVAVIHPH